MLEVIKQLTDWIRPEAVNHSGMRLPARHFRLCGAEFGDDAFYVASATREGKRLADDLGVTSRSAVLDIGCGTGRLAIGLLTSVGEEVRYTGIDVNRRSIEWCRRNISRNHPRFRFVHIDAANERYNPAGDAIGEEFRLPFADGEFDVIYLYSIFSHMVESDVRVYVREIARLTRAGGRAFLTAFVATGVESVTVNPESDARWHGPLHCVRYSRRFFDDLLVENGLRIDRVDEGAETDGQSGYYLTRI